MYRTKDDTHHSIAIYYQEMTRITQLLEASVRGNIVLAVLQVCEEVCALNLDTYYRSETSQRTRSSSSYLKLSFDSSFSGTQQRV